MVTFPKRPFWRSWRPFERKSRRRVYRSLLAVKPFLGGGMRSSSELREVAFCWSCFVKVRSGHLLPPSSWAFLVRLHSAKRSFRFFRVPQGTFSVSKIISNNTWSVAILENVICVIGISNFLAIFSLPYLSLFFTILWLALSPARIYTSLSFIYFELICSDNTIILAIKKMNINV